MARLDTYERRPSGMDAYLSMYGWHFSKRMAQFAAEKFCNGTGIVETKLLETICKDFDVIKHNNGYDAHYLFARFRSMMPGYGEKDIARLVDCWLKNNYETSAFTNFYSDCIANGIAIIWEDMI